MTNKICGGSRPEAVCQAGLTVISPVICLTLAKVKEIRLAVLAHGAALPCAHEIGCDFGFENHAAGVALCKGGA